MKTSRKIIMQFKSFWIITLMVNNLFSAILISTLNRYKGIGRYTSIRLLARSLVRYLNWVISPRASSALLCTIGMCQTVAMAPVIRIFFIPWGIYASSCTTIDENFSRTRVEIRYEMMKLELFISHAYMLDTRRVSDLVRLDSVNSCSTSASVVGFGNVFVRMLPLLWKYHSSFTIHQS